MTSQEPSSKSIVMLHGGPGFYGYMHTLGELLPTHHQVTCFAQRGSLANPKPYDQLTLEAIFDDIDEVLSALPTDQTVVLVGHSWGANLALLYAANTRKAINRIVLFGPAPLTPENAALFETKLSSRFSERDSTRSQELEESLKAAFEANRFDAAFDKAANERLNLMVPYYHYDQDAGASLAPLQIDFRSFLACQGSLWGRIESGLVESELKTISQPVLHLHGEQDPIPHRETARYLQEHLPNVSSKTFAKCGHFPWLEPSSRELAIAELVAFVDSEVND